MSDETVTTTEVVEKPTHVVIDNSNLEAVLANARGEEYKPEEKKEETKTEAKAETKESEEDGLTDEQRATFTENMKKTIGKKHRAQKEAEELAEEQYNARILADRRAEKAEREAQRLREQIAPPKQEEVPKKPNKADFKTDEDYQEAMVNFRVDEKMRENEERQRQQAQADRQREVIVEAQGRIASAKELVPDFAEVVEAADVPVPPNIAGYMQESEMFAELGYHFAKNPEVLENLAKLSPAKQLVAIGKIESTLKPFSEKSEEVKTAKAESNGKQETAPSTNGKSPSKARQEPIKPLETGSSSQVTKPSSEMSWPEFKADWQKRNKVNFSARKRH